MIDNISMLMMENCARLDAAECQPSTSGSHTPHHTVVCLRLSALRYQLKWKMLDFLELKSCHYASVKKKKKNGNEKLILIACRLKIT